MNTNEAIQQVMEFITEHKQGEPTTDGTLVICQMFNAILTFQVKTRSSNDSCKAVVIRLQEPDVVHTLRAIARPRQAKLQQILSTLPYMIDDARRYRDDLEQAGLMKTQLQPSFSKLYDQLKKS